MKKAIITILAVLLSACAVIAVYRFCFRKSIPDAPVQQQVVSILEQSDCFVCHSFDPKMPFYASFPVIGPMMEKHAGVAVKFVELEQSINNPTEVTVSMIEHAVHQNTMPIAQYKMIHWGTAFNKKEKSVLLDWIAQTRTQASNGLSAPQFQSEPVQVIPDEFPTCPQKVALGKAMYNDTRISLDNTISCATCHILKQGGADESDERVSAGINGLQGGVNAPTVYNSFYNVQQFWNGRAADLQEQAAGPPVNPVEMGDQTWDQIVERLCADKALVAQFKALYPEGLTQATVTDAIAEYEKTLITPNCAFDRYLKGDAQAITDLELAGYQAFKDNSCAACHTGIILGGKSFEYLGIFEDYFADRAARCPDIAYNSDDEGLKGFTGNDADLHKFKVPGLRNVALTAPYFHDGSYQTLQEAIEAMYRFELGKKAPAKDLESITAFLNTLTGEHEALQ